MKKKRTFLLLPIFLTLISLGAVAQYTGFDLENKKPPSFYPGIGPGEREVVNQLQQTNRLLEQNNHLLTEQNRLLRETLKRQNRR